MANFKKLLQQWKIEKKFSFYKSHWELDKKSINTIMTEIRNLYYSHPFFVPTMKDGTPLNVKISSFGKFGWIADEKGYYYSDRHPLGQSWNPIPETFYSIANHCFSELKISHDAKEFDTCLINFYEENGKLGMHIDNTEKCDFPILSISVGCTAKFKIEFGEEHFTYSLYSGDYIVMDGLSRYSKHGILELISQHSNIYYYNPLKNPKTRINLTFRKTGL